MLVSVGFLPPEPFLWPNPLHPDYYINLTQYGRHIKESDCHAVLEKVRRELQDEDQRSPRVAVVEHERTWIDGTAMYSIMPSIRLYNIVAAFMTVTLESFVDTFEPIEVDVQFLEKRAEKWVEWGKATLTDVSRSGERLTSRH